MHRFLAIKMIIKIPDSKITARRAPPIPIPKYFFKNVCYYFIAEVYVSMNKGDSYIAYKFKSVICHLQSAMEISDKHFFFNLPSDYKNS